MAGYILQWRGPQVIKHVEDKAARRLWLCAVLLRDQVVKNISIPVVKEKRRVKVKGADGKRRSKTRTVVTERSKPGEFPRADTTRLMKDIFFDVGNGVQTRGANQGKPGQSLRVIVGTTLEYGKRLELYMNRSFLLRTLNEQRARLKQIIAAQNLPGDPRADIVGDVDR